MTDCSGCGATKPYSEFYRSSKGRRASDGNRYTQCRGCLNEATKKAQGEKRAWLSDYKLLRGCADCGYNEHPAALDFDHLPGVDKSFTLKDGICSQGWPAIKAEVLKCEVVCANCHRVRTADRREEAAA